MPRTVVVSGCDSGLGREFAAQYADDGWKVVATYLDPAGRIENAGVARHVRVDVTSAHDLEALRAALDGARVDLLVSSSGIAADDEPPRAPDLDRMRRLFEVNALGAAALATTLVPNLEAAGRARIAFVSSRLGSIGHNVTGGHLGYRASKAALNAMGRTLAIDLHPLGISVVMLHPGWVRTGITGGAGPLSPEDSVRGMRRVIAELGSHETGEFLSYTGRSIGW